MNAQVTPQPCEAFEMMIEDMSILAREFSLTMADDEIGNPLSLQEINSMRRQIAENEWRRRLAYSRGDSSVRHGSSQV